MERERPGADDGGARGRSRAPRRARIRLQVRAALFVPGGFSAVTYCSPIVFSTHVNFELADAESGKVV